MNTSEFSEAIAKYTLEETVNSIVSTMRHERKGELPEEAMIRTYYGSLDDAGKAFAETLARYSVSSSIFKLLVVLDNCDAIEDGPEKGEFSLHYTRLGTTSRLGEPPDLLHDALPEFSELIRGG